ncbi:hypothetical protein KEM52_003666 [Ascosphaera acerosa]|nr:hypothetical protein KEM52_003666 [Ascosphaera acerosa]
MTTTTNNEPAKAALSASYSGPDRPAGAAAASDTGAMPTQLAKTFSYAIASDNSITDARHAKAAHLADLRALVPRLQADVNAYLTERMDADKAALGQAGGSGSASGSASAAARRREEQEEANYGEENKTTAAAVTESAVSEEHADTVQVVISNKESQPVKTPPPPPAPPSKSTSCLPFSPTTAAEFGLIQERLAHDPFRLLIATIFLNKTRGKAAKPVLDRLFATYPTPAALAAARASDVAALMQPLGLQNTRAQRCVALARRWAAAPPARAVVWFLQLL